MYKHFTFCLMIFFWTLPSVDGFSSDSDKRNARAYCAKKKDEFVRASQIVGFGLMGIGAGLLVARQTDLPGSRVAKNNLLYGAVFSFVEGGFAFAAPNNLFKMDECISRYPNNQN